MSKSIRNKGALLPGLLVTTVALLAASPVIAEAPPRVRGVVTEIGISSIAIIERDGSTVALRTSPDTTYADVVPASLNEIKVNDFIGAAVKVQPSSMIAVELVIIPASMRAGRISYYGWDPLPDPTAKRGSAITPTSMTNGLVSNVSLGASKLASTNMTNGSVSAEHGGAAGLTITVTYNRGSRRFRIIVPKNTPITRYKLAVRSTVTIGSSVFIKTSTGNQAGLVTVGKGITPPQ